MQYPESVINVAVHFGETLVKIYGPEHNHFRPYIRSVVCATQSAAIQFCADHNTQQRKHFGLVPHA